MWENMRKENTLQDKNDCSKSGNLWDGFSGCGEESCGVGKGERVACEVGVGGRGASPKDRYAAKSLSKVPKLFYRL